MLACSSYLFINVDTVPLSLSLSLNLDSAVSHHVDNLICDRVKQLEHMFKRLARHTYLRLVEMKIDIKDFYAHGSGMNPSLRHVAGNFFKQCFKATSDMVDFWGELNRFWDFYNFELLQHIIQTMFDDIDDSLLRKMEENERETFIEKIGSLRIDMETYEKEITDFSSKTKVCDFFRIWPFGMPKPDLEEARLREVVLKVEKSWEDYTLLDIKKTANIIAQEFFLSREFLLIGGVKKGSVSILWYVPPSVARLLEKGMAEVKPGFFVANGFQSISINDVQLYPLTPMREYSLYIQRLYETKQQPLSSSKSTPDKFLVPFKLAKIRKKAYLFNRDEFTERSLRGDKDDIRFEKSPTDLDAVGTLPDGSPARLVLIEGAPGVGKTTFSWKVCQMWGRKEILQNISTLVLLPLRDHGLKEITNLGELLAHTKPGAESLVEEIEANKGEGIAFWLDGWDEIASTLEGHSSIYERLVSGEVLPKATVIVSSRPWATNYIKQQLDKRPSQHIEIVASVHDQIEYLLQIEKKHPSSKSSSGLAQFLDYLDRTPAIRAAMHTPMATRITLEVFHWSQETGSSLPSTVTDLYTAYTCLLVHTHLDNHPLLGLKSWKSNNFRDLPEPVNKMFIGLCQLAYEGLLDGQRLVFPDLPKHLKHLELETLGLMQAQAPLHASEDSAVLSYHYNHLTVQEFLSAYFILQLELTEIERSETCPKFVEDGHFTMVMRFLSGQTESTFIPRDVMRRMLMSDKGELTLLRQMLQSFKGDLTVFHWLFEGGKTVPVADILGDGEMTVTSGYTWTALDYYITGCVITRSNCTWDVDFNRSSIGDEGMELFIRGLRISSEDKRGNGHIGSINLSNNDLSFQILRHLVDIPAHILCHLKEIDLRNNKLDRTGMDHIAKTIPHLPQLETLSLWGNADINRGGAVAVVAALCDHKVLKQLDLSVTNIGEEDCKQIARLLSCSQTLEKLDIGDNSLTSDNIHIILNGLHKNSSLKHLVMDCNHMLLDNMKSLSVYLQDRGKCKLETLNLKFCNIEPETAVELAHGLSHNCSVKTLDLTGNHVGDEGATALGQTFLENKTLTRMELGNCGVTTTGGTALATSLLANTTLEMLDISYNALGGGEAIETFAKVLQQNKTLEELNINDNTLSQSDVSTLVSALGHNQTLEELWLPEEFRVETDKRVEWVDWW